MNTKEELRALVRKNLDAVISKVNMALRGEKLGKLRPTLERVGRGSKIPHWFERLSQEGVLPNLDGKSIGSVVEMLLIGVLETYTFKNVNAPKLRVNPARGVDLPDLDLGVKSPSENYCTSEPYFSAYERLYGSEYDVIALLTDYQTVKNKPPLRLQLIKWGYLTKTQLADINLCRIARKHRELMLKSGEARTQRLFRFLAFVNQSDWLGKKLVSIIDDMNDEEAVRNLIANAREDFMKQNAKREKAFKELMPEDALTALQEILKAKPLLISIADAADNWVGETLREAGRLPNDNEWNRLKNGPLDGKIGMSFALQWRYNFGRFFGEDKGEDDSVTS